MVYINGPASESWRQQNSAASLPTPPSSPRRGNSSPRRGSAKPIDNERTLMLGAIVQLPYRSEVTEAHYCLKTGEKLADMGYNHPAVILRTRLDKTTNEVHALVCTISANKDAGVSQAGVASGNHYFAISLKTAGGEHKNIFADRKGDTEMVMETLPMRKPCNVLLGHIYEFPMSELRVFENRDESPFEHRFNRASYQHLLKSVGIPDTQAWSRTKEYKNLSLELPALDSNSFADLVTVKKSIFSSSWR